MKLPLSIHVFPQKVSSVGIADYDVGEVVVMDDAVVFKVVRSDISDEWWQNSILSPHP